MTDRSGLPRREFLKAAVAAGGVAALGACLDRESADVPTGPDDPDAAHPRRQHAWTDALPVDDHGNPVQPRHRVLLYLDYGRDGPPADADRRTVERALRGIERAYERTNAGLLFTVSYSRAYFDRYGRPPAGVDLPHPEPLAPFEDPTLDRPDAVVHLASDHAQVVLGAEAALTGERDAVNGVEQPDAALTDALAVADRRTGFIGDGLPAEHDDVAGVPEGAVPDDAPMFMGFKSGFAKTQASEDRVTIRDGPFAGGTTQHVSKLLLNLEQWYEQDDRWQRVAKMFSPHHAETGAVEGVGDNLGDDSGVGNGGDVAATAGEMGVVGHAQKAARVREDGEPLLLRRDFDSTDGDRAGVHFLALQRRIADFVRTREAMNGTDLAADAPVGQRTNNGILQYVRTVNRGNYLVPPRPLRALPPAAPAEAGEVTDAAA
jgi:hypothetical protein